MHNGALFCDDPVATCNILECILKTLNNACTMYCLIFSPTATRKEKKSVPQKKVGLDYLLEELELEDEAAGPTQDTSHTDKEISLYMSLPVVKGVEPLEWWKANQATFPTLAKLAKRYLCVPATSCSSERDFSLAGNIITHKRNSLKPAKVNRLCFLCLNLRRLEGVWKHLGAE